ncbi:MAG: vWA domain-containing protein [Pseudothermotoga sp.]
MKKVLTVLLTLLTIMLLSYQIQLRENEVWWPSELWNALWCSVTVKDDAGNYVRNLKLEDFTITEKAYDKNGELLEEKTATFKDHPSYRFNGSGFWEKSINSDKLDIAFFIDGTGSMRKHADSIIEQLHQFVDRMIEVGTDFRIFISMYETEDQPEWTISTYQTRFFGPAMIEEIRAAIDDIDTWGEWWNLTWGYDVFLWSLNLDWRPDARKIVVIITDVYTDSVYGPNWYFSSGCVTSMSAVDLAIRETGIQLYYCQPPEDQMAKTELSENYSDKVNIKVKENNFDKLELRNPMVKRLSWPFNQQEIELKELPIVDSKYYFAWVSNWGKYSFVSRVEVNISIAATGESTSFTFYPLQNPDGSKANVPIREVKFTIRDESGLSMLGKSNVSVYFYKVMGDLDRMSYLKSTSDENGILTIGNVVPGKYYYILRTSGSPRYSYDQLGYTASGWIVIDKDGPKPNEITAYTLAKDTEIYRMSGLLQELESLDISTQKMKELAREARKWLEKIQENGIILVESEAIKRFNVGAGALINCAGYADVVQNRSTDDLVQVTQKMTNMVREARKIIEKLESAKHILLKAANLFVDIITGNWSGVAANLTIEALVDKVVNYVRDQLVDDILQAVREKLLSVLTNPETVLSYFHSNIENYVRQQLSAEQIAANVSDFVKSKLVYPNFTNYFETEIDRLLSISQNFVQENYEKYWNYYTRSELMRNDFRSTRAVIDKLFSESYRALKDQQSIDNWQSVLIVFRETIPLIVEFIQLFEVRYPELTDVKNALKTLYSVLDAIGTMTRTYEAALKINHLEDLQGRVKQIVDLVY